MRTYGAALPIYDGKVQYTVGVFDGEAQGIELTYASFVRVFASRTDLDGKVTDEGVNYVAFGNATAPNRLPRSGSAAYAGVLFGDIKDGSNKLASLTGRSELTANFANGALTASLTPIRVGANGGSTQLGKYAFSGSINAYTAAFTAELSAGIGEMNGRFYGDKAQEYAAVFNIADPTVGRMIGVTVGKHVGN